MIYMSHTSILRFILAGLLIFCLAFLALASNYIPPQASIDAAYYHVMADQIEKGAGFTEPFIWHFLNDYQKIEHPMDYWMPLGILFYYFARFFGGVSGEIWLNIAIWSILVLMIFTEVKKNTGSFYASAFASCTMLFCGRYLFYLLTTDNVAFYALLGYFFFRQSGKSESGWAGTAVVGGLSALMRIEGLFIALAGGIFEFCKNWRLRTLITYSFLILIVLSPWLLRNYKIFGHPWPSNSKALFLQKYDDMFRRNAVLTLDEYLSQGYGTIISGRVEGLKLAILNLIAVPGALVLYPLWLAGLLKLWNRGGKQFCLLLGFFIVFCGLIIPLQSDKGSALHIGAFFFPFFAVLNGVGLFEISEHYKLYKKFCLTVGLVIIIWLLIVTYFSTTVLVEEYAKNNAPYQELFANLSLDSRRIVSATPIVVYLETGLQGVMLSSHSAKEPLELADAFACDTIIMDQRASGYKPLPEDVGWQNVASSSYLHVFFRNSDDTKSRHE